MSFVPGHSFKKWVFSVKIAVVLTISGTAGSQQAAVLTAHSLACAGHEVSLLLPEGRDAKIVRGCALVNVHSISEYYPTLGFLRYLKNPKVAWRLRKSLRDCVHDLRQHLQVNGYDIVLAVHPTAFTATCEALDERLPIAAILTRIDPSHIRMMRSADAFLVTTEEMAISAVNNGVDPKRCHVLPHCVLDPELKKTKPTTIHSPIRLGGIGRLEPNKGMSTFVSALNVLMRRNIKFKATICGEGSELSRLTSMTHELGLKDQIDFPGWIEGSDKNRFFETTDILVQPASRDSFGIALVEGMAHGLPIVSGNTVGARHIITHGQDGLIFNEDDPTVLADCLEALIADKQQLTGLGKNARTTYERNFTPPAIGNRASEILKQAIEGFHAK